MELLRRIRKFRKYKPKDYSEYLKATMKAILDNVPDGYEITNLRVQLDPEFDFSSIDYSLEKKT